MMSMAWRIAGIVILAWALQGCASTKSKTTKTRYLPEKAGETNLKLYREADENRLFIELNSLLTRWEQAALKNDAVVAKGIEEQISRYVKANYDLVRDSLSSTNERFRVVSAASLGFSGRPDTVAALLTVLADSDELVVSNALLSLGQLSPLRGRIGPVVALLDHPSASIRSNAFRVLSRNLDARDAGDHTEEVLRGLADDDGVVRLQAVVVAEGIGGPEVVRGLLPLLRDPYLRVKVRAAVALGNIGEEAAVPSLIGLLDADARDLRFAAEHALESITGESLGPSREDWARYWNARTAADRAG